MPEKPTRAESSRSVDDASAPLLATKPTKNELVAEGNVVGCCCIFVSSIVLDALNALPTTVVADVPVSLRTTAFVLIAMVAAPPVEPHFLFEQRALAFVLLALAAWVGLHHGGPNARLYDGIYCLFGGWATVLIYGRRRNRGGERGFDAKGRRENVVALSAAFLGYAGFRIVRAGFSHATEVSRFTLSDDDVIARGYALADDLIASALTFGGLMCVCAAVIVLMNHDLVYEFGCFPLTTVMAMMSVMVFTAAFLVQIASYARLEDMATLFGDGSCSGSIEICSLTYRARRMQSANTSPATLWACAVGLTLFAFPYERRCHTRRDYFSPKQETAMRDATNAAAWVAVLSTAIALATVFFFVDATSTLASLEVFLMYVSIPAAWFGDTWFACALHAAGIAVYTADRVGSGRGVDPTYLTHWCMVTTLVITLVLAVTTGISQLLYASFCAKKQYVCWVEDLTAGLLVALVSLQLLLTVGSLGLVSGYDGSMFTDGRAWTVTSFEWATQHCISFFFTAALIGSRYECQSPYIPRCVLQTIWFAVPLLLIAAWTGAILVLQQDVPYGKTGDWPSLLLAAFAALVPWIVIGIVVC